MSKPDSAMVLAAGMGTRMRPLTDNRPKPLVELGGRALLDHVLDRLADAGIARAVVNIHYRADQIETHLAGRVRPQILISDERDEILDTGGGVLKALDRLGPGSFFVHNSDSVWIENSSPALEAMIAAWNDEVMDALLLLAPVERSIGYAGAGDFIMDDRGRLARRGPHDSAPYIFAGVSIMHPRLLEGSPEGPFSLNKPWDEAIAAGRLYGMRLDGLWMHVGTPVALSEAEALLQDADGE